MRCSPAILLLALASCAARKPPPGASGLDIYRLQNCANCHGPRGEGTRRGPPLVALAEHWTRDALAGYLADPVAVRTEDERLSALGQSFSGHMQRYDNLDLEQRRVLAAWLLTR